MDIYQGKKNYESLEALQKGMDIEGRRITIVNQYRTVTIRPQVVQTFHGSLEQLYELGLKLGGTPTEVWARNKNRCEETDALKEKMFARILQLMEQGMNVHRQELYDSGIKTIQSILSYQDNIDKSDSSKVSDILLGFRVLNDDGRQVTGLERVESFIDSDIQVSLGMYVGQALLQHFNSELACLLKDRFSPYFDESHMQYLDLSERQTQLYNNLLKQPDILSHQRYLANKLKEEIYALKLNMLFEPKVKNRIPSSNSTGHEEWTVESFVNSISPMALHLLLGYLFGAINPLSFIHEAQMFTIMTSEILKQRAEDGNEEAIEFVNVVDNGLPLMRELIAELSKNPEFMLQFMAEIEDDDPESDFLEDIFDSEFDISEDEEYFRLTILSRSDLSWKAKAIAAYILFKESGWASITNIVDAGKEKIHTINSALLELEEAEIGTIEEDQEFALFYETDGDNVDDEIDLILDNPSLSWKAKGIGLYLHFEDSAEPRELEKLATDGLYAIKTGIKELEDQHIITKGTWLEQISETERNIRERIFEEHSLTKEWYSKRIAPLMNEWLNEEQLPIELLSAKYPRMDDRTAIELAILADDTNMVRKILKHPELINLIENSEKILEQTLMVKAYEVFLMLFHHPIFAPKEDQILACLLIAILQEADTNLLKTILETGININQCTTFDGPLQAAIRLGNEEIIKLLLEHGASPYFQYVGPKFETIIDYANAHARPSIKILIRNYWNQ